MIKTNYSKAISAVKNPAKIVLAVVKDKNEKISFYSKFNHHLNAYIQL